MDAITYAKRCHDMATIHEAIGVLQSFGLMDRHEALLTIQRFLGQNQEFKAAIQERLNGLTPIMAESGE